MLSLWLVSRPKLRTSVYIFLLETKISLLTIEQTKSDAEAYSVVAAARAQAQKVQIEAEAHAHATRLAAEADAAAIRIKAKADSEVLDGFAREMERLRLEVARIKAFGPKTIFVPTEGLGSQMGNTMAIGMSAGMGSDRR